MAIQTTIKNYIKRAKITTKVGVSSSFLLGLLLLFVVLPLYNVTGVEDSEAATSYTSSTSSITFSTGRNTATISGTPTTSGTFISSSTADAQVASFDVTTNNATGYTLSIASNKADTSLTNSSTTLSALESNTTTNAGLAASDFNKDTYNNMWGYMPSKVSSSSNTTKFYPMTSTARTLDTTSGANSTANNYTIKLGARINYGQAAGTYTVASGTSFTLTAVGNPATYSVSYNANGGSGAPTTQSNPSFSSSSFALSSTKPSRSNYDFLGWCTVKTSDQANGASGSTACSSASGTYYASGATFYLDECTTNVTTLYAIWAQAGYTITFAASNASSITVYSNNALSSSTTYTNGQTATLAPGTYYIYGNFSDTQMFASWSATAGTLLSSSSRTTTYTVNGNATLTLTGRASVSTTMQDFGKSDCESLASSADYTLTDARDSNRYTVRYINGACWMTQNLRIAGGTALTSTYSNVSSNYTIPTTDLSGNSASYTAGQIHNSGDEIRGYWYNYCAASAGTVCSNTQANASYDICPKNWHLAPYGSSASETGSIRSITSSTYKPAFSPIYGGNYYYGSLYDATTYGSWWSATANGANNQYFLYYNNGSLNTYNFDKYNGYYVRCVRDTDPPIYMQDLTMSKLSTLLPNEHDTATVYDKRDEQAYTIAKSKDGKYWMATNLNLAGGTKLYSDDSNVPSGYPSAYGTPYYTLPASSTSGFSSDTTAYVYNSNSTSCGNNSPCYSYYSYLAATAGTGSSVSSNGGNATGSICPKGWRLPTSTTSNASPQSNNNWKTGDWYALATAYGANLESNYYENVATFYNNAGTNTTPNFLLAGYYNNSSFGDGRSYGYYWSATSYSSSSAYNLSFRSGGVNSADNGYRRYGFSVRCVKDSDGYMQDFSLASASDNTEYTLKDSRDSQLYTVKKINGQWWMTRNLAIGCNGSGSSYGSSVSSKTLTSANSNVSSNFSTPTALLSAASSSTQTADYSAGRMQCSPTYGAWYNYYAASAGTISTNSNSAVATYSICPSGWKLPTGPTTTSGTDFNNLVGTTGSGWQNPTEGFTAFNPVAGGRYGDGSLDDTGSGFWWSATALDTTFRYYLSYYSSNGQFYGHGFGTRYYGRYVRCVRSS